MTKTLLDVVNGHTEQIAITQNLCKSAHNDLKWCVSHINQLEDTMKNMLTDIAKLKAKLNEVIDKWQK